MIDEFRAAFQELIDASVASDTRRFPAAVRRVYDGSRLIPSEEREMALEAMGTLLDGGHTGPGITADLCVVAGAMVESGAVPGDSGTTVVRLLRTMGQGAAVFLGAWHATGPGDPPDPDEVTVEAERRVAARLGDTAATATICWWTIRRHALAAMTMLGDHRVRAAVRADATLSAELIAIANQLSVSLAEFDELRALLRMTGATSAMVLDRDSGRGFQVLFEGIGDNFQLHTLLADALVGEQGRGLAGHRPDPRWTAAFRDSGPDPEAGPVRGWWNLLALDGSWVWNEGVPADIPTHNGEHVLVLGEQPYVRAWNAGRRHPHVSGWLEIDREVAGTELADWWRRAAPGDTPSAALRVLDADPEPFDAFGRPAAPAPVDADPEPEGEPEAPGPRPEAAPAPVFNPFTDAEEPAGPPAPAGPEPGPERAEPPAPPAGSFAPAEPVRSRLEDSLPAEPAPGADAPPVSYPPVTEQIPVLTAAMLEAYAARQDTAPEPPAPAGAPAEDPAEDQAEVPAEETPPAPKRPPLPPGVSDSSAWGPRWR